MCVIIDANDAGLVFSPEHSATYQPVLDWLTKPLANGILVFGGKLKKELAKVGDAAELMAELERAGRARSYSDEELQPELLAVAGRCRSNDEHVIALARKSKARTLVTHDRDLTQDFGDRALVKPPGKVYRDARHGHLLRHTANCPGAPKKRSKGGR